MFKIESYITPLLMGYVDKYIKLRPEDFQLSLWGGDAVLNNLDLRLDVIERAIQLPIIFKSGHIHELRIHVPWTKLGSEPVVITVNTIECILKLRDTAYDATRSSRSRESRRSRTPQKPRRQGSDDLPPGYLQSLINKILNNVSIIVNNLILKFVEDDIVLSVNVKSVEMYSADASWNRAFSELLPPELALRKSINFSDLTVCLDKCDASGKIDNYQDPLIYRCSVTGRVYMKYDSQNAKRASVTKFDLFCEKFDISLTDLQLPMFLRLIELCLALYYGTMEFPSAPESTDTEVSVTDTVLREQSDDSPSQENGSENQGWASWAWSYVPQILPTGEEGEEEGVAVQRRRQEPPTLSIGMYAHKASLVFKLTERIKEKVHYGPHKVLFKPFLLLEGEGIALDILMKGLTFFDVQFGVTSLHLQTQGHCICGTHDECDTRSKTIIKGGSSLQDKVINYYSHSLFDIGCHANQGQPLQFIMDGQQRLQVLTEQAGMSRFGVLYQNYLYVMQESEDASSSHGSNMSSASDGEDSVFPVENSLMRFIIGSCHFNVSSSAVHRIQKFMHCAYNHSYEPYAKTKEEIVDESRPHPTPSQVTAMEENIPTRTRHLAILQPIITVYYAEHEYCDVKKKTYRTKTKQKGSTKPVEKDKPLESLLPCVVFTASRFDLQGTNPMYPRKLIRFVSKMAQPSSNLLHHCHSHVQMKLFEASAGLVTMDTTGERSHPVTLLTPFSGALYTRRLLLSMYWKNPHLLKVEQVYELPQGSVGLGKPNLLLLMRVISSWYAKKPSLKTLEQDTLLSDVFNTVKGSEKSSKQQQQPVIELTMNGLEMKKCQTRSSTSYTGTLSSLQVILYSGSTGQVTPLLTCPADTSRLHSPEFFRNPSQQKEDPNDFITFTYQVPHQNSSEVPCVLLVNVEGCVGSIDPAMIDWFSYCPELKSLSTKDGHVEIDQNLAQATSPLVRSSRLSSVESVTQKTTGSLTRTTSQIDTQTITQPSSQKLANQNKEEVTSEGEKVRDKWRGQLIGLFSYIRMMQLQVNIKPIVICLCETSCTVKEPSMFIPSNLVRVSSSNAMPSTMVVSLPQLQLTSSGLKPMSALQDIPIQNIEGTIIGEKLPWTMQLDNFSVYTLKSQEEFYPLLKPVSVGCTIAVSSKFSPPNSTNLSALGLCLHTDMRAIEICVSKSQVELGLTISGKLLTLFRRVVSLQKTLSKSLGGSTSKLDQPSGVASKPTDVNNEAANYSLNEDILLTDTETSGVTVSRETTPSHDLDLEGLPKDRVRLSLWLQWTLPKAKVSFYHIDKIRGKESKVSLVLEDMTMSVDIQEVYAKVKATCGACNCLHYERSISGSSTLREKIRWSDGPFLGKLLTCRKEISEDIHIIADRHSSSSDVPASTSFSSSKTGESLPRDVTHGFINFTFTRALCKNVTKKMRKLNMEMQLFQEIEGNETYDLYFHKYISELCLNVEPCDVVCYVPAVKTIINCCDVRAERKDSVRRKKQSDVIPPSSKSKTKEVGMPLLSSNNIPLLYVTVGTIRVFIPSISKRPQNGDNLFISKEKHRGCMSTIDNDLLLAMVHSISIDPQADNPLPRYAVEKDLYHRALQLGLTQQPGSAVENRQYQIDIKGMEVCTGFWSDFEEKSKLEPSPSQANPKVQIPALEWNTMAQTFNEDKPTIQLVQVMSSTDLKVIFAPAIVYTSQVTIDKQVLVCGYSLEVNVTNKLDMFISTNQILLMMKILEQASAVLGAKSGENSDGEKPLKKASVTDKSEVSYDSGIESESVGQQRAGKAASPRLSVSVGLQSETTAQNNLSGNTESKRQSSNLKADENVSNATRTPFDVLLTANVISCTLYKHAKLEQNMPRKMTKIDLEAPEISEVGAKGDGMDTLSTSSQSDLRRQSSSQSNDQDIMMVPFLHLYFSQPHTVLSCQRECQKLEMSCYDILVKGSEKEWTRISENHILPEWSSFSLFWLETRPGEPNHKTGIPPSLYTLRVTDFLLGAASILMKLERPLKINVSVEKLQKALKFLEEISPKKEREGKRELKEKTTSQKVMLKSFQDACGKLDAVNFQTQQIMVAMETGPSYKNAGIMGSVESVEIDTLFKRNSQGVAETISLTFQMKSALVRTALQKKFQPLLDPMFADVSVCVQFPENSDVMLPRVRVYMTTGLVTVSMGQEHVMCLHSILNHLKDSSLNKKASPKSSTIPEATVPPSEQKESCLSIIDQSRDDLRMGKFEYIMNPESEESMEPEAGKIVFCNHDNNNNSSMTWSYNSPRVISLVHFTPIPFNVSTNQHAEAESSLLVPCVLQYYEETTQDFMDYIDFELSENSETMLELPELKSHNVQDLIVAQTWRVVVRNGMLDERIQSDDQTDISCMYILPASLAASMRVDSAHIPALIPNIQTYISMASVSVKLSNHFRYLGQDIPDKLRPFVFDDSQPMDQEFCTVTLGGPTLIATCLTGQFARNVLQVSSQVAVDVIEYRSLTIQNVVRPFSMYGDINLSSEKQIPRIECNITAEPIFVKFGRGVVHTLNCTSQIWSQLNLPDVEEEARIPISHYFICNDTCHTLRFGQIGTDENLPLLPREMHAYSWRTHKSKQSIHVCVDGKVWKWCEPFSIDDPGHTIRVVRTLDQNYTLIIYIKKVSNVQKQIIIRGQLVIASRLSHDLEVKVTATTCMSQITDLTYNLRPKEVTPTYIVEQDQIHCIKIRLLEEGSQWSKEIHVSGDEMVDNRMVKLTRGNGQSFHVWCKVFCQHLTDALQIMTNSSSTRRLVLITPLYIVRSHLPRTLYVNMETPKLKDLQHIEVPGQGGELQIQCLGQDFVHNLSFHLSPTTEKTTNCVSLSSGLIDQVEHTKVGKMDIDDIIQNWKNGVDDIWPYCYVEGKRKLMGLSRDEDLSITDSSSFSQSHEEVFMSQPSLNINISLTEYWPQCSTLLVDVLPWCLLTNQSGVDLVVIETDGTTWNLPSKRTFTPPKFNGFYVGLVKSGNLYQSPVIPLSTEEEDLQRYRPDRGRTLFIDGYVQTRILIKEPGVHEQFCFFTLQSAIKQNIRVISVTETYSITNFYKHKLMASLSCLHIGQEKFSLQHSVEAEIPCHSNIKSQESNLYQLLWWSITKGPRVIQEEDRFAHYMALKCATKDDVDSGPFQQSDWSMPLRLAANETGFKGTVSVPMLDGDFDTVPLCISGHEKKGLVYYVIREDRSPCFVLYNHTPGPVVYGHQDNSLTGNIRIQEETELILDTPTLPPGRNIFYTPSAVSKKFIGGAGSKDHPKLIFGFYPHNTEVKGKESIVWSRAIDVNADMESFLPIPQCTDVKVKVRCVAMVTHITIEPISRAEISAREVRNRIKGKDTDIVIGHTEEVTHVTLTNQDLSNQEEAEKVVVRTMKKKPPPGIQLCLGAYFEHLCLILQDEVTSTEEVSEVVQVCVDNFYFSYLPSLGKSSEDLQQHTCYSVCIGSVQIDNQMFYLQGLYDFPVLFIQQKEQTENFPNISRLNVIEKLAVIKSNSFAHIQLVLESDCLNHSVVKSLEISMHPAAVNIDDNFIYRLLKEVEGLIPVPLNIVRNKRAIVKCLPMSFKNESKTLSSPIRIEQLCIQPVNMLLSVHASLKLFLASDRTPLSFGKLEKKHVCTTAHQLTRVLTMHYASGALFRAGIVVGSLEILGNPTGLVRSIGTGVADLVKMPYSGLTKGPGAFVSGISNGMSSFVRNISSGMITSVTNFASSVSRNMDILSLDDAHQEQQEERRHRQPAGLSSGLKQGLTGFGMSLLGAVAGLADQPLQTVMSRQVSTERPSRLAPATGIVKGVGKGLVGVLTKPIGGAAEFVSQTGQGILQGTGLAGKQPGPRYSPEFRAINTADNSSVKSQMKLLQSIPNATLLMSVNACFIDLLESEVKVQLLLTNELLVVISVEDDAQQQAFSLAELEILNVTGDSQLLSFELKDSHQIEEACPKHEVNKERVEAFIDGALEYAQVSPPDTPPPTDSQSDSSYSPVGRVNLSPKYHFRLEPFTRSLFIELFCMLKNKLAGKGFPVY